MDPIDEAHGIIAMVDIIRSVETSKLIPEGYGHYHERYRIEVGAWRIWRSRLSRLHVTAHLDER